MKDYSLSNLPSHLMATLQGHMGSVMSLRFNREGALVLSCGKDLKVLLWNPLKQLCIKTYEGHGYEVRDVAIREDSANLASVGADMEVFVWDVPSGKILHRFH